MVIQIASIMLRVCGTLALILGLLFWIGYALNLIAIHMLLGLLLVLSLWIVGIGQAFSRNGSWMLAIWRVVRYLGCPAMHNLRTYGKSSRWCWGFWRVSEIVKKDEPSAMRK